MPVHVLIITQNLQIDPCDYAWQTAKTLAKQGYIVRIFWTSEKRKLFSSSKRPDFLENNNNITNLEVIKILPFERFELIKDLNTKISLLLFLLLGKVSLQDVLLIMEPTNLMNLLQIFKGKKFFDYQDNYDSLLPKYKTLSKLTISKVDQTFVHNSALYREIKKTTAKVKYVPMYFVLDEFKKYQNQLVKKKFSSHLRFVFVGTICTRLDFPLLFSIIESNPQHKFIFVGPVLKEFYPSATFDQDINQLFNYTNVEYLGVKSRIELAQIMSDSDVGLIPYDPKMDFNQFSSPMKVLEYFFFGLPVFATNLSEMKTYREFVTVFNDAREFSKKIKLLQQKGWSKEVRKKQRNQAVSQSFDKNAEKHILSI